MLYVIGIVVAALLWLFYIVLGFAAEPILGILALLLGWIPAIILVVLFRLGIENAVALIRTAENTTTLVKRRP